MNIVLINATASNSSGALTVLKDFISFCKGVLSPESIHYILFTSVDIFEESNSVSVVRMKAMSWKQRIKWDNGGLKAYCKKNGITPNLIISFQNTSTKFKEVPQLVYYHQSLVLVPYRWNVLKKDERILFLYAHFYKFFVNRNNKKTDYVVQLPYIKELFCKKFWNVKPEKVHVVKPNTPQIDVEKIEEIEHKFRMVYPAIPMKYKNHEVILKALNLIKRENAELLNELDVIFTVPADNKVITEKIKFYGLENIVKCSGALPYDEMLKIYKNSEVLLFPSKIETYGMPLMEASLFGLRIVAADLPYAREVLCDYENKIFVSSDDAGKWANEIRSLLVENKNPKQNLNTICNHNTWIEFLNIAENLLSER